MESTHQRVLGIPKGWVVIMCAALFYCYQFVLRVSPNVMHDELMQEFRIDASSFGMMISFYSWSYAVAQLPLGIIMDRFGAGRLITLAAATCSLSCLVFASTQSFYMACFSQFLIGLGSACGFLGTIKLGTLWFPPSHIARVVAVTLIFGTLGAALGGAPLSRLTTYCGWKETMYILSAVGLMISVMLYLIIGRYQDPLHQEENTGLLSGIRKIIVKPQAWLISIYGMLMYVPITTMGTTWGVPYILSAYPLSEQSAASVITALFIGAALGSPFFSLYSDKIQKRRRPMIIGALLALLINSAIVFTPPPSVMGMSLLFFAAGFAYTAKSLSFSSICEIMPKSSSGVAVGFINMFTMANGALFLPMIGNMLDYSAMGQKYTKADYQFALSVVPFSLLLAVLIVWFIRETHHRRLTHKEKATAFLSDME